MGILYFFWFFQEFQNVWPFDFWGGANFKLKIRNVEGYRNYDKSEFDGTSELFGGDEEKLEKIYDSLYGLNEFIDPENYKSYADLKKKLYEVLGEEDIANTFSVEQTTELNETRESANIDAPAPKSEDQPVSTSQDDEDGEDTLAYFAKLAQS